MEFRKLKASEIETRVATVTADGCSLLLYKDARVDQNLLDETVGPFNWQRKHELIGSNLYCTVSIRDQETGEWVSKQDVGAESFTDKEKGQASDSFKRACFNWGIGRELYTAPFVWIPADKVNIEPKPKENNKYTTRDTFEVTEVGYDSEGNINHLVIYRNKKKQRPRELVYEMGRTYANSEKPAPKEEKPTPKEEKPTPKQEEKLTTKQVLTLRNICNNHKMPEENVFKLYGRASLAEMTQEDWGHFNQIGQEMLKRWDEEHGNEGERTA